MRRKEEEEEEHDEEKGEEVCNHSFASSGNLPASRLTQKSDDNKKLVKRQIYYKTRKLAAGSGQCDEGQSCFAIFHFLGNICEYDCFRLNLWKHTNYSFYDCLFTECPRTQITVMAYCHQ